MAAPKGVVGIPAAQRAPPSPQARDYKPKPAPASAPADEALGGVIVTTESRYTPPAGFVSVGTATTDSGETVTIYAHEGVSQSEAIDKYNSYVEKANAEPAKTQETQLLSMRFAGTPPPLPGESLQAYRTNILTGRTEPINASGQAIDLTPYGSNLVLEPSRPAVIAEAPAAAGEFAANFASFIGLSEEAQEQARASAVGFTESFISVASKIMPSFGVVRGGELTLTNQPLFTPIFMTGTQQEAYVGGSVVGSLFGSDMAGRAFGKQINLLQDMGIVTVRAPASVSAAQATYTEGGQEFVQTNALVTMNTGEVIPVATRSLVTPSTSLVAGAQAINLISEITVPTPISISSPVSVTETNIIPLGDGARMWTDVSTQTLSAPLRTPVTIETITAQLSSEFRPAGAGFKQTEIMATTQGEQGVSETLLNSLQSGTTAVGSGSVSLPTGSRIPVSFISVRANLPAPQIDLELEAEALQQLRDIGGVYETPPTPSRRYSVAMPGFAEPYLPPAPDSIYPTPPAPTGTISKEAFKPMPTPDFAAILEGLSGTRAGGLTFEQMDFEQIGAETLSGVQTLSLSAQRQRERTGLKSLRIESNLKSGAQSLSRTDTMTLSGVGSATLSKIGTKIDTSRISRISDITRVSSLTKIDSISTISGIVITPPPDWGELSNKPPLPPIGFPSLLKMKTSPEKSEYYDAEAKNDATHNANWVKVNKYPMTRENAIYMGADIVDTTVSATFRIKPRPVPARDEIRVANLNLFNKPMADLSEFRDFRIEKGRKINLNNMFIEENKHRIDSQGEFEGITVKGWLAKRKKNGLFG